MEKLAAESWSGSHAFMATAKGSEYLIVDRFNGGLGRREGLSGLGLAARAEGHSQACPTAPNRDLFIEDAASKGPRTPNMHGSIPFRV